MRPAGCCSHMWTAIRKRGLFGLRRRFAEALFHVSADGISCEMLAPIASIGSQSVFLSSCGVSGASCFREIVGQLPSFGLTVTNYPRMSSGTACESTPRQLQACLHISWVLKREPQNQRTECFFCFLLPLQKKCEAERTKFTEEIAKLKAEAAKRPSEAGKTASWAFQ